MSQNNLQDQQLLINLFILTIKTQNKIIISIFQNLINYLPQFNFIPHQYIKQFKLKMSNQIQLTPSRIYNHSPQIYSKYKRSQITSSPSTKRFTQTSTNKSSLIIKRNNQEISQKNQKIITLQTKLSRIQQKLAQYQQEKQALQNTLKQRVQMYKKIIKQKEQKSNKTIESIQHQFKQQIKQINQQKEQQSIFFEQQSEILNKKIEYLQLQNYELSQKVNKQVNLHSDLVSQNQLIKQQNNSLKTQFQIMMKQKNSQVQKYEQLVKTLNEQHKQCKLQHKNEIKNAIQKKQTQIRQVKQRLQNQIKILQNIRNSENAFKDNQISQLKKLLQTERLKFNHIIQSQKLKYQHIIETQSLKNQKSNDQQIKKIMDILHTKQSDIDMLNRDVSQLQNSLKLSNQQNSSLKNHINQLKLQSQSIEKDLVQCSQLFKKQKLHLMSIIQQLKQQIRLNQVNYIRQKDKNDSIYSQNVKLHQNVSDKQYLLTQINQLRHLLLQSSKQIQICRQKFLNFQRQNKKLLFDIQRLNSQNNSLLRVRRDLQEQAIKWRQNYLRVAR